jgi:hypothetical protein
MAHTVVNGHYFLTAKSTPTEVSKLIFNVSFWHSWISAGNCAVRSTRADRLPELTYGRPSFSGFFGVLAEKSSRSRSVASRN